MTTFKEASDLLCLTAVELSDIFGRDVQHLRQSRLDPSNPSYRKPPPGWEARLSELARERGGELLVLADTLAAASR